MTDTTEDTQTERDALAALVASDGFRLLREHVDSEFGPEAYARYVDSLLTAEATNRADIDLDLRVYALAARKIQLLMKWPSERLAQLKGKPEAHGFYFGRRRA